MINADLENEKGQIVLEQKSGAASEPKIQKSYTMTQFEVINALYDSRIFSRLKLTAGAKLVLIALARHFNPTKDDFFPSYSCIAEHTGISKKSVERGIKELSEAELISYRTQKVNRYRFTPLFFRMLNLEDFATDVKMSADERQNVCDDERQNVAQTNKAEKRNKKEDGADKKFDFEAEGANQNEQSPTAQSGNAYQEDYKIDYCKYSQSKVYSKFRAAEKRQNDAVGAESYYQKRARDFYAENARKDAVLAGDGGGSRVPSAAESEAYINELRESRKYACAPIDFEPERAERWYKNLTPILKTSVMARKVASKFGFDGPKYEEL